MKSKILQFNWGTITCQWNDADAKQPSEMLCYDTIGKDPWSGGGISSSDFQSALNEMPVDRALDIKVNSKGGDVHHGMAMGSDLENWKNKTGQKVYMTVTGIAASTASWAFLNAADEVRAHKGSQIFVHDAMAFGAGNAAEFRKAADNLDKTSDQIAGMYSEQSGKSKKSWRDKMKDETLMTAEEAAEEGLVDKIIENKAVRNFTPREIANISNQLLEMKNSVAKRGGETKQQEDKMKEKLIAMLNELDVKEWEGKPINKDTSDEHLEAALKSVTKKIEVQVENKGGAGGAKADKTVPTLEQFNKLQEQLDSLSELANAAKTVRVTNEIDKLISNDQLTAKEKDKALARALKDDTYLDELKARPTQVIGGTPLKPLTELVGNSFNEVQGFILENTQNFMRNFIGSRVEGRLSKPQLEDIRNRAIVAANTISKHKKMLVEMFNANVIDPGVQRQVILQEMLEEFAVIVLPLTSFSTVFNQVPLEGTDTVDVPFYPLAMDAGNSWDSAVGYNAMGNTETDVRAVVIGGSGVNSGANAPAGTCRDRKWIGAAFSSYEMDRQPYLNVQKLMIQKANRLGVLIFKDFVSRVITAANFGASIKAVPAAQFSGDDIADLWENATGRNWPDRGRSLVLTHQYKTPLLKDPTFKQYLAYGATDPLRKAKIQEVYGFEDIPIVPNMNTYSPAGENLVGWINHMYAALFATAPIMPTPDVRALMTRYDVVINPALGATFEYRRFGNVVLDQTNEVVECSYGGEFGVQSALARITSA